MALELEFANFNVNRSLDFMTGETPEDLLAQIRRFRSQLQILALYWDGKQHIAWVRTNFPIKKRGNK